MNTRRRRGTVAVFVLVLLMLGIGLAVSYWPSPAAAPTRLTGRSASYAVQVDLATAGAGTNTVEVRLRRHDEAPVAVREIMIEASMPGMGHAMPRLVAASREPGRFEATGELFGMPGVWQVTVRLRDATGTELVSFSLPVR